VTAPGRKSGADANLDSAGQDRDAAAHRRELVIRLAGRRAAAGLSQADVAKLMQTSQSAVARLESGRHDAQLSTLARYAEALGLSLLSLDLAGDAGIPDRGPSDDGRAEAARTSSMGQVSLDQPRLGEPPQPEARPKGRPGRKPKDNVPAVTPAADTPGPDHVLSWRQRKVLQVIRESIEKRGHPPTLREIGDAVGLTSTSSVSHHLGTLQRAGYLNRDWGRPRTVEVRDYTAVLRVRSGTGFGLRRNAFWVRADDQPDGRDWDLVATPFADMGEQAEYAASFGRDVVVVAPPELREAVIAKLKAAELEDRPVMSRLTAGPGAAAVGTAPGGTQAGRHVVIPDDDKVEQVAGRLGAALAAGRRVHLRHHNERKDVVTERDVDPMRLFREPGHPWPYLDGWCLLRENTRTFRLDRVLAVEVLDVPASPPPAAYVNVGQGLFPTSEDDTRVELELSGPGRRVTELYTFESVSPLDDGRLRVVLRTSDTSWVWRLALRLGENGRVVSPPGLVAEIRWAAAAALANYETSTVRGARGRSLPGPGQAARTARAVSGSSAIAAAATTRPSATAGA
jgi:predicted DNA-binding transcriptional regulator YafY/transcriptional regulator with XRE-family HTH domain